MAFTDPIALQDYAAVSKSFNRTGFSGNGASYVESTASPSNKRNIVIKHTSSGLGPNKTPVGRHLVQISQDKWNATLGKTEKLVVNLTVTMENTSSFTTTELYDLFTFAKNFIGSTNIDKLVRNES